MAARVALSYRMLTASAAARAARGIGLHPRRAPALPRCTLTRMPAPPYGATRPRPAIVAVLVFGMSGLQHANLETERHRTDAR